MPDAVRERLEISLGSIYAIERELGGGGMSRVFVAEERALGRTVVIKALAPEVAAELSAERFAREVKLAARLQHPHIVPVLAAGEADGLPYYVMPYVEGESLRHRLARVRVPVNEGVAILKDVLRALDFAHSHGVVHRDIKPENVLLAGSSAVVTDFGIAKAISASATRPGGATLTQLGTTIGTPAYMAPEQAAGDPSIDARADIYSWGVLAYEVLSGEPPFSGAPHELMRAHMSRNPADLHSTRPDVAPLLAKAVHAALAKDPSARPASAGELLGTLESLPTSGSHSAARPSRRILTVAAAAVGLVVAAIAVLAVRGRAATPLAGTRAVVLTPADASPGVRQAAGELLGILSRIPGIELIEDAAPRADSRAASAAREKGARIAVVVRGDGSSALAEFRVLDAFNDRLIRRFTASKADAAGLEQIASAVAIATSPLLGPAAIPGGAMPKLETLANLSAMLETWTTSDSTAYRASLDYARQAATDTAFIQARLWQVGNIVRVRMLYYRAQDRLVVDSILSLAAHDRPRFTPFERAFHAFLLAARRGSAAAELEPLRRLAATAPESFWNGAYVRALLGINRVNEARELREREFRATRGALAASDLIEIYHYLGRYREEIDMARDLAGEEIDMARDLAGEEIAMGRGSATLGSVSERALVSEARVNAALGRREEVEQAVDRMAEIAPSEALFSFAGNLLLIAGQEIITHGMPDLGQRTLERASDWFRTRPAAELEREDIAFRDVLADYTLGRYDAALAKVRRLEQADPADARYRGMIGKVYARMRDSRRADSVATALSEMPAARLGGAPTLERALIASILGRTEQACALFREAFTQGQPFSIRIRLHWFPDTQRIRGAPCYKRLITPED